MMIRAAFILLATTALFAIAGGLAVGIGGFLLIVAPLVGWGLGLGLGSIPLCWGIGRWLTYRERQAALTYATEERRIMLFIEWDLRARALAPPPTALARVIDGQWREG